MALNLYAADRLAGWAAVIIDEFHERSWEVELLVALLRGLRARPEQGPKLVLCSATLAAEDLAGALNAAVIRAEGRSFPVAIDYLGESAEAPGERDLERRVAAAVKEALAREPGDVLVFLPGKGEIDRCAGELEGRAAGGGLGAEIECVAVHGGVPPQVLVDAFAERPPGAPRRVFLATNVAESALTLPGVRAVVDSGLARMRVHRGGRSVLALTTVARDSMDQRAGRAGRVAPGRCLRLWSQRFVPREVTAPEIERIELDDLVLRAAGCGLDGPALDRAPWLAAPPSFALDAARERLRSVGALAAQGRITALGESLAGLPVSAEMARVLLEPPPELAASLAELVALLELGRSLALPLGALQGSRRGAVDEARAALLRELPGGCRDEVHASLWLLRHGRAATHGLHPARLREARRLADSLAELVGARRGAGPLPARAALVAHLLARIPEALFVRRPRADRDRGGGRGPGGRARKSPPPTPWGNGRVELGLREWTAWGLEPEARDPEPRAGLILDHEWIGTGSRARGAGRMLLPCSFAEVAAAGLGELEVTEPSVRSKPSQPLEVVASVERRYAGAVLEREARVLEGEALRRAVVAMLIEGRRLPGLAGDSGSAAVELRERVADELHLWTLINDASAAAGQASPLPPAPKPSDPREDGSGQLEAWLEPRLAGLGLEQGEDWSLLEADDLSPRCAVIDEASAALVGDRERDPASLLADFPRLWSERGASYACAVDFERRRVTLRPDNGSARKRGEPKRELLPRFRGFSVFFVQASRRLRLR
nr:helicase-related protein [Pseudenhygromyxa sp. WMMC2535]